MAKRSRRRRKEELAAATNALPDDIYLDARNTITDLEKANTDQHDKAILQLTTAALGISITFLLSIAPHPFAHTLKWLGIAWVCLGISIAAMLSSFQTGQEACRRARILLDRQQETGKKHADVNRWSTTTLWLNRISSLFFVFGLAGLTWFAWLNVQPGTPAAVPETQQTLMESETNGTET